MCALHTLKAKTIAREQTGRRLPPGDKCRQQRCPTAAASSRRSGPSSPRLAALHPSLLLDAACTACCVVLLASSATSQRQSVYSAVQHSTTRIRKSIGAQQAEGRESAAAEDTGCTSTSRTDASAPVTMQIRPTEAVAASAPAAAVTVCAPPTPLPLPAGGTPGLAAEAVACCTLLVAASNAWFKLSGSSWTAASRQSASTEAAARLARLEAVTDKQLAEFSTAVRQIDKLQVRTRLTSGDIRRPIAQLQSASADQSAVLVRLASEQEALRGQLRDTQALLAALQGLTAKQFQVTVEAIKQLRSAQAAGSDH
ncbi:hypothetical protein Vretimale_1907 [Volvox reticuliferus]|uniref:Uncharacterized protein n=1 Tax=Volvox reticuliferus TaxID=1737510 RepID=A0A8J4CTI1_9CHLO|nr:hypothetical protein Vretifemale_17356 [Volvox reticuliferus]GIL95999.1 hypothetical protein Vretimale_1907 [Volvox reticuliferus]